MKIAAINIHPVIPEILKGGTLVAGVGLGAAAVAISVSTVGIAIIAGAIAAIVTLGIYLALRLSGAKKIPPAIEVKEPTPVKIELPKPVAPLLIEPPKPQVNRTNLPMPLVNRGNSCFLASIVQTWLLSNAERIQSQAKSCPENEPLQTIATFIEEYRKGTCTLEPLLELLTAHAAHEVGEQEDAMQMLEALDRLTRLAEPRFPVERVATTYLQLPEGGQESREIERVDASNGIVQIPFAEGISHFHDLLEAALKEGNLGHKIDHMPVESKQTQFSTAPDQFVFHMGRFGFNKATTTPFALRELITEIPLEMTLPQTLFMDSVEAKYALEGAIIQKGGLNPAYGHYIAVTKRGSDWFLADDSKITPLSMEKALEKASNAYILLYRKI